MITRIVRYSALLALVLTGLVAGHWARLRGELVPARDAGHQGTLRVSVVNRQR